MAAVARSNQNDNRVEAHGAASTWAAINVKMVGGAMQGNAT